MSHKRNTIRGVLQKTARPSVVLVGTMLTVVAMCFLAFSMPMKVEAATYGIPDLSTQQMYGIPPVVSQDVEEVEAPIVQIEAVETDTVELRLISAMRTIFSTTSTDAQNAATEFSVKVYSKKTGKFVREYENVTDEVAIQELRDNKGYRVEAVAHYNGFTSDATELVVRTAPELPRGFDAVTETRNENTDVIDNGNIGRGGSASGKYMKKLSWKKPNGKIRSYTVRVYSKNGETLLQTKQVKRSRAQIVGLKSGKHYRYSVQANFNDTYSSAESKKVKFRFGRKKKK